MTKQYILKKAQSDAFSEQLDQVEVSLNTEREINTELRGIVTNMTMMDLNDKNNRSSFFLSKKLNKQFNSQIMLEDEQEYSFTEEGEID